MPNVMYVRMYMFLIIKFLELMAMGISPKIILKQALKKIMTTLLVNI